MQFHWIHRQGQHKLILYFAGWSTPPQLLAHYATPVDTDVLACFDYQSLKFDIDLSAYEAITVVAWSFGVWVAQQVLSNKLPIVRSIAINGTGKPVDDNFGIPKAVFATTLANMNDTGREKFERRMCGSQVALAAYHTLPQRSLLQIQAELQALSQSIVNAENRTFIWHRAIIGLNDHIIPAENQQRYFNVFQPHCEVVTLDAAHLLFAQFSDWQALCR